MAELFAGNCREAADRADHGPVAAWPLRLRLWRADQPGGSGQVPGEARGTGPDRGRAECLASLGDGLQIRIGFGVTYQRLMVFRGIAQRLGELCRVSHRGKVELRHSQAGRGEHLRQVRPATNMLVLARRRFPRFSGH